MSPLIILSCCVMMGMTSAIQIPFTSSITPSAIDRLLADVQKRQTALRVEIKELRDDIIEALKIQVTEMYFKLDSTLKISSIHSESENIHSEQTVVTGLTYSARNPVFYAQRNTSFKMPGKIVNYDSTVLNIGNGFDALSGVFTAPKDGIYFFYFSGLKEWGTTNLTIQVMLNNQPVNSRHVSAGDRVSGDHWATLESQVTLPLNVGDTVAVKLYSGSMYDTNLPNDFMGKTTTFSGFLLQEKMDIALY